MNECIMKIEDLNYNIMNVFGEEYNVDEIIKIIGGAQKGTFKIICKNGFIFILHIWHKIYDEFSQYDGVKEDFTSNSAMMFQLNNKVLKQNKISTPEIYYMDISKSKYSFEFAFVQYIDSIDLEKIVQEGSEEYSSIFFDLQNNINKLHNITSTRVGDFRMARDENFRCEDYIYKGIKRNLEYLYNNFKPISIYEEAINYKVKELYENIEQRQQYSLVHWELGPNHVLVDKENKSYLIDIEGMKFFDLEFEHSFLQLRFGKLYKYLSRDDLDINRIRFYKLSNHIGALTGAYKLLVNDYVDKEDITSMIRYNYNSILKFL